MSLKTNSLDGTIDKVAVAIRRMQTFEPTEGYRLAFSGGKDSVVIKALADMAGVKYQAHYSLTTVDPPELVRFIRTFTDVIVDKPVRTMWQLISYKRMPPLRMHRYCCEHLKEAHGKGEVTLTGVRWAESSKRKNNRHLVDIGGLKAGIIHNDDNDEARRSVEQCYRTQMTLVNPIIDWADADVWEFIHTYGIRYCSLYDEGWKRLGCIGCPMSDRKREFERWPKYKKIYIDAFQKMLDKRRADGFEMPSAYSTGQECFDWWMDARKSKPDPSQIEMEDEP